jgi:hypothetical protein
MEEKTANSSLKSRLKIFYLMMLFEQLATKGMSDSEVAIALDEALEREGDRLIQSLAKDGYSITPTEAIPEAFLK